MKKILSISLLLLWSNLLSAQVRELTADSDTAYWLTYYNSLGKEIGLELASENKNDFYFRFWDGYKVIEVSTKNGETSASVSYFLRQYRSRKKGRLFVRKKELTNVNAERIRQLVSKYSLLELPTDEKIDKWQQGLDGITYVTEHADKNSYSFKNYWTPTAQKGLAEAEQLLGFIAEINQIEEVKKGFDDFMRRQPFWSYYAGIGSATIVTKITNAR